MQTHDRDLHWTWMKGEKDTQDRPTSTQDFLLMLRYGHESGHDLGGRLEAQQERPDKEDADPDALDLCCGDCFCV
jgi:hypothetical protein